MNPNQITDSDLDAAILKALYPNNRNSDVQLSVDIENSGGAIRTGMRCHDLERWGLICCTYTVRDGNASYWQLTAQGRLAVQNLLSREAQTAGGGHCS